MPDPNYLRGLVDMGSNGIRFSITDLHPSTARNLPTIYQDRAAISLYTAQYASGTKTPIPASTITAVLAALTRFKQTCADFNCTSIRVLATEATREATNSAAFRAAITSVTGWTVEMLPKEEEGRVGALGVASSCARVHGLVMDLGGGSTQLTWLSARDGEINGGRGGEEEGMYPKSVSLPLGAAALLRRIEAAETVGPRAVEALRGEVRGLLADAYERVRPVCAVGEEEEDDTSTEPFHLFLSGGGFRGWGYLLMDSHAITPYPIAIINGFEVAASAFRDTAAVSALAASSLTNINDDTTTSTSTSIFRVSDRRATQVPAVALLVSALVSALPEINSVRFCQGGVREGALFAELFAHIRAQAPLATSTKPFAPVSGDALLGLLAAALPKGKALPEVLEHVLPSVAHLLQFHASLPKETRAAAALRCTTVGVLAGVHGVSHMERAALALVLAERWGAEVSATDEGFFAGLRALVGMEVEWWTRYLGRVAALVGEVYPTGVVMEERVKVVGRWLGSVLVVDVGFGKGVDGEVFEKAVKGVEKIGKKKNWIGGKEGWGVKIDVRVSTI